MYAIFQRSTGWFLPERKKGERGYTHTAPTSVSIKPPRLFVTERAAKIARTYWLQGRFTEHWEQDEWDIQYAGTTPTYDPTRNPNDIVVVSVVLSIP